MQTYACPSLSLRPARRRRPLRQVATWLLYDAMEYLAEYRDAMRARHDSPMIMIVKLTAVDNISQNPKQLI